jgi:RNase P/RNase MRP subunit POP5
VGDVVLGRFTVGQAVRTGQRYQTWRIEAVEDDELESVAVSEVLRSADLLASTSAIALDDRLTWLHHSAQTPGGVLATRRTALKHVLAELSDSASIEVGRRHVAVGIHQIHLATGRVTYEGEPVTIEPVTKHQLWTPPDPLLNRIVGLVVALLDESRTP